MINVYNKARQYFSELTIEEHINAKAKMNKNGGCSGDNLNEINSRMKLITSPGWMHETSAQTWCIGKT